MLYLVGLVFLCSLERGPLGGRRRAPALQTPLFTLMASRCRQKGAAKLPGPLARNQEAVQRYLEYLENMDLLCNNLETS